mmetsp:Transcript_14772/g.37913  ORF Transcript_14772/g.37913 Transcript_14772/m.37913 type:complete len:250 (-) Transcript_14772:696-1445(-)
MNSNATVKVRLCCAHLHGDAKSLEDLVTSVAHHVQTDDPLIGERTDQLHERAGAVLGLHRKEHVGELGGVDFDAISTILGLGLGLGEPARADGRVREKDGRHPAKVLPRRRVGFKQPVRQLAAGGDCDRRQRRRPRHVTDSIDPRGRRVLIGVHPNESCVAQLDSGGGQPNVGDGGAADSHQDLVDPIDRVDSATAAVLHREVAVVAAFDRSHLGLVDHSDTGRLGARAHPGLDVAVKGPQQGLASDHE